MRKIILLAISAVMVLSVASCKSEQEKITNRNALWVWSTHMHDLPLQEYAEKGYGHVMLNDAAFDKWDADTVFAFAQRCKEHGIKPHVWFHCYGKQKKWAYPVNEETMTVDQSFYDDMVQRAVKYIKGGFEGIHLDYIRFAGTAHKYNCPETGLSAVWLVNECCRQMSEAVKAVNPNAIMSGAIMPETDAEHLYGQRPSEMGQYLDVLIPMIYRYGYFGKDKSIEWVEEVTKWFLENSGGAEVWVGIQTYTVNNEDNSPIPMDAEGILSDCTDIKNFGADGVALFRHGLGEFPDLNTFWD
jgi:hypothetical protein